MRKLMQILLVLLIAGGLKAYYSISSVNDLRWVLAPTTILVEIVTGESFTFESYAGYMNADNSYLIAASCSGMNFMITAFLMLSLLRLWRPREASWTLIPISLSAAYLTTIVANTVRIAVSVRLHRMSTDMIWVNPDQLHRFEGIFAYFGFLLLLFVLTESLSEERSRRGDPFFLLRRSFLPLLIYWAVTLGIPIVNGALSQGHSFWEHSAFVVLTPLILILPLAVYRFMRRHAYDHWRTQ